MSLTATVTLDARDPWNKCRRMEIFRYGNEHGLNFPEPVPAKTYMIAKLKEIGLPPPNVPPRPIGKNFESRSGTTPNSHRYNGAAEASQEVVEIDADELLMREYEAQKKPEIANMGFNDMRAELKAAGVKLDRKWGKAEVKAQLEKLRHG